MREASPCFSKSRSKEGFSVNATAKKTKQASKKQSPTVWLAHPPPKFDPKATYREACTVKEAESLVREFVERALTTPGIVHKEPFLGTPALFEYLHSLVNTERQRNNSPITVGNYVQEWEDEVWRPGTGVDFSLNHFRDKLVLINGQRRSCAFTAAKAVMEVWLSYSKDPEAQLGFDQDDGRNAPQLYQYKYGVKLTQSVMTAAAYDVLDFPTSYRARAAQRLKLVERYKHRLILHSLPGRGKVGQLAPMLRALQLDTPDAPWARLWFTSLIRGIDRIGTAHVRSLELARKKYLSYDKYNNGDYKNRLYSWLFGTSFLAFYEGRTPKLGNVPANIMSQSFEFPITMKYIRQEIKNKHQNRKVRVFLPEGKV
jgi:hypothetical protein